MAKEELKQEAEGYCANNCGDCYGCHKKYRKTKNCEKIKSMIKTYLASAEPREKRIAELEAQIEKMKCCQNCENWNWKHNKCEKKLKGDCFKYNKWVMRNI